MYVSSNDIFKTKNHSEKIKQLTLSVFYNLAIWIRCSDLDPTIAATFTSSNDQALNRTKRKDYWAGNRVVNLSNLKTPYLTFSNFLWTTLRTSPIEILAPLLRCSNEICLKFSRIAFWNGSHERFFLGTF